MPTHDSPRRSPTRGHRFHAVASEVFQRYGRTWKPSTLAVNRIYLRNQILPWFGERPVRSITRAEVQRWFSALHKTPAAADRSLPILSVILRQAEIYGYRRRGANPCLGIRRYRRPGRQRFLTMEETRRLGATLAAEQSNIPLPAALVRLLLLTGCRQSEIRALRWSDYREDCLFLSDSKVGPRTVWLSRAARSVLDLLPRRSVWVFPASRGSGPMPSETLSRHWRSLRRMADLPDVRLHDLRHTYASLALRRGETVLTIGRLLGHRDPATTLRYLHFGDAMARLASERVGRALGG